MKVAIVAPSPVPFVVGGAEKLWWGMQRYINEETAHSCELFKIPVQEHSVRDLLQAYYRFFTLDMSCFDRVISTKYPAFMVQHPDHHLYLQHLLRGCYDTYPSACSEVLPWADADAQRVIHAISREDIGLSGIFDELFSFLDKKENDALVNQFPGPFIRKVLRTLDRRGMEGIKQFSAISQTVKDRQDYFPPAADVAVIHHPSNLSGLRSGDQRYLFTASRLDSMKRIDLLIRGFMQSRVELPFLIAGTGPEEARLKKLAGGDSRVRFLGFVSDRDIVNYYADAAAVLYAPHDEDYGLITIEAFCSGKPVITCDDSGGVTEFVVDGKNGAVAKPNADSLASAINATSQLLQDKVAESCRASVKGVSWSRLMARLLDEEHAGASRSVTGSHRRKHAVVVSTYPVFPPVSGGQLRIYHMLRRLSCRYDISLLSLGGTLSQGEKGAQKNITPHFTEYVIPETESFRELQDEVEQKLGISATDITFMCHDTSVPDYAAEFKTLAQTADLVICAHPYAYPLVRQHYSGFLVYDAHNMEYLLKSQMVKHRDEELLQSLFAVEQALCQQADVTITCAEDDTLNFQGTYALTKFQPCLLPNGIAVENTPFLSPADRLKYKQQLGIKEKVAIFIGSGHQPNIDAVQEIISIAEKLLDVRFIIIGSVANAFVPAESTGSSELAALATFPEFTTNLGFTGVISNQEKNIYLQLADIALNPMQTGSGSNLKLAEYIAAGIPVISTSVGARGYRLEDAGLIDVAEIADFVEHISAKLARCEETKLLQARACIIANYDWDAIIQRCPFF